MKAILVRPSMQSEVIEVTGELSELQALVGGYIEAHAVKKDIYLLCDEDAIMKGSAPNIALPLAHSAFQMFYGNLLFIGRASDEDFAGLTEEALQFLCEKLRLEEM